MVAARLTNKWIMILITLFPKILPFLLSKNRMPQNDRICLEKTLIRKGGKKGESLVDEFLSGLWQTFAFYKQGNTCNFLNGRLKNSYFPLAHLSMSL